MWKAVTAQTRLPYGKSPDSWRECAPAVKSRSTNSVGLVTRRASFRSQPFFV